MKYSKAEKSLLDYVIALMGKNEVIEFDFRDEKQYAFAQMNTKKFFDTTRYPGMLKAIELQKEEHIKNGLTSFFTDGPGFNPAMKITNAGFTDAANTQIGANAFGTTPGGYQQISLILFIKDNSSGNIIASGMANELNGDFLPVNANIAKFTGLNSGITTYLQYSITPNTGNSSSGMIQFTSYNTVADPTITEPVATCTKPFVPNAINIGIGRSWGDSQLGVNLDYIFPGPSVTQPTGQIPFVGSVTFAQAIKTLNPGVNFLLQIYVANETNGGMISLPSTNLTSVYSAFSIDTGNSCVLKWNLPGGTSASNPGSPILFGNVTWPSDMLGIFCCQIVVTLADGTPGAATVISQLTQDDDPSDGTLEIWPISFVWHCLGEDTLVSMADGTKKTIGKVIAGDEVMADNLGRSAVVVFTNKGMHVGSVLYIKTDDGKEIVTSHNHVFMTTNLPLPASELTVGDTLLVLEGKSKISSIENLTGYNGMFYNLATTDDTNDNSISTFVANGFVVGDMQAQRTYKNILKSDINWVKRQVPEYLHKDVDSYFEDKVLNK